MLPKFKNHLEYEKAQVLMQPIFIRLLDNIRKESEALDWVINYEEIKEPLPGYIVYLKKDNYISKNNIWELCFQICFNNYSQQNHEAVEIDQSLLDEHGELNWQELENKTKNLVTSLFVQK